MLRREDHRNVDRSWLARLGFAISRSRARASGANRKTHNALGKFLIVNGHPDPRPQRYCAQLCAAYAGGAHSAGWDADVLTVATLSSAIEQAFDDRDGEKPPSNLAAALVSMRQAARLTIIFPLWLDRPPELLAQFFHIADRSNASSQKGNVAQPTRIVVTMEMPAFAHRRAHRSATSGCDQAFTLSGVSDPELTFIGSVDAISDVQRGDWLATMRTFGVSGL
jgi:putative NADPH-quinone reductase